MKKELNGDDLVNWWLEKYHNTNLKEVKELHPEWLDGKHSRDFYQTYPVTQEQHDKWYEWAIQTIMKHYKWSKKKARKEFVFPYWNCSPTVKQDG